MQEADKKQLGLRPTEAGSSSSSQSASAVATDAPPIGPGTTLGKYRIVRKLGAGGMGSVFEATHLEIGKAVALKTLGAHLDSDPQAKARFLREAAAAAQLD